MTVIKAIRVECKYKTSRGSINGQEMLTNQYHFEAIRVECKYKTSRGSINEQEISIRLHVVPLMSRRC